MALLQRTSVCTPPFTVQIDSLEHLQGKPRPLWAIVVIKVVVRKFVAERFVFEITFLFILQITILTTRAVAALDRKTLFAIPTETTRRQISSAIIQTYFSGVQMQVALAAMLALTLIMLKMLSGSSGPLSLPVVDASQRGRRRLLCRAEDESTSIFVIPVGNINQCSQRIGDFASNYPRMGRFCHNHKVISVLTEEDGDPREYWRASIEAATVTAKQKTRQTSSSAPLHSFLRESGRGIWLSTRIDAVRRSQLHRLQQQLYRHRPWRTHDHTEQAVKWPVDISQGLQVQATSKCCAFSRWSEKRCKQLRRTVSTYRPLVFVSLQPIRLAAPRCGTHFVTRRITRSASHLSRLKVETVRRAEAAFSAVHAYAEPVFQRLTRGLDSPSKDGDQCELQHKGSRLVHLTDKTVQSVIDVVARDDWEHVATTSGVVVHRQYITLGSDGMPAPPSSWETVAAATPAVVRKESGVTGDGMSDRAPQGFACVKATAILNAPPEVVFMLFADNSRVSEYNEHCKRVIDVEILAPDTKITWAASGRMGPFKVRTLGS